MITVKDKVRFVETDLMGVVHHSKYFNWFEMGRVEYLRSIGISLNELLAQNIVFPITDVSCKYRSSARFDDIVLIQTTLKEVSKVKMVFTYEVMKEADTTLLATGETQNVFTDGKGKIIRLPDCYYEPLRESV
ncbi:acyl-CoA thioester hydrolase [Sporomusaceae bacterium BoRhaA]|uniref:acyl-CoA thioesterase n=1 Tax=Pelorhabdus rhamnosifermentans TaxID=2772457 RepID=UPI001C062E6C|nr:thioesterase family protein [Pelorhabdus rhamnosifermentans]MBU2703278.1 acyl-CoA thioester hydrolase [Pelorhabdus rhamnosifermentans]